MFLSVLCLGLAPPVFLLGSPGEPCWHIHTAQRHGRAEGASLAGQGGTGAGEVVRGKSSSCSDSPSGGISEPQYFMLWKDLPYAGKSA